MQSATATLSGNVPAEPNSFIGRERDLAELARLLGEVRALTLSGPGGIGKTRLAVRLAHDVIAGADADEAGLEGPGLEEAWLVELADWHGSVAQASAVTIGIREEQGVPLAQTLAEALRSRRMLLILDTCEHQVGDCATLVQLLLGRCPWLRIIATRTAPLRQQTLRATVDWSYELLDEAEQMLLRRLAAFSGWNLDMAEQVCSDEAIGADAVLGLLISLIDKSLVVLDGEAAGDARYRLLATIREYAAERLAAPGEKDALSLRPPDRVLPLVQPTLDGTFHLAQPPRP